MPRKSPLREAGYVGVPGSARRVRTPDGREVSYRRAYKEVHGRSLEQAVRTEGKYPELDDAKKVRQAARDGKLAPTGLVTVEEERALARQRLRDMTRGHFYSEATKAGVQRELQPLREFRRAARAGLLSTSDVPSNRRLSRTEEQRIASAHLRDLKSPDALTKKARRVMDAYVREAPTGVERESLYGRLLGVLRENPKFRTTRPMKQDYPDDATGMALYKEHLDDFLRVNGPQSLKAKLLVAMGWRVPEAEYAVGETP